MSQPLIKLLLLAGIVGVAVVAVRARPTAGHRAFWRLAGSAALLGAALSILFPDRLTELAHALGVGRGVDLVVYGLAVSFLFVTVILFRRIGELERRITLLVRQAAIAEASGTASDGSEGGQH